MMNRVQLFVCTLLTCHVYAAKPPAVEFVEKLLKDSVPLAKCESHPAYEEEPGMFKVCSFGETCYFVAGDNQVRLGSWCENSTGSGDETEEETIQKYIDLWRDYQSNH